MNILFTAAVYTLFEIEQVGLFANLINIHSVQRNKQTRARCYTTLMNLIMFLQDENLWKGGKKLFPVFVWETNYFIFPRHLATLSVSATFMKYKSSRELGGGEELIYLSEVKLDRR